MPVTKESPMELTLDEFEAEVSQYFEDLPKKL